MSQPVQQNMNAMEDDELFDLGGAQPFNPDLDGGLSAEGSQGDERRGPLLFAMLLGVGLVFSAIIWNTYRDGVRMRGQDLPILSAGLEPYKVKSEPQKLEEIPGNRAYSVVDGGISTSENTPSLAASAEDIPAASAPKPVNESEVARVLAVNTSGHATAESRVFPQKGSSTRPVRGEPLNILDVGETDAPTSSGPALITAQPEAGDTKPPSAKKEAAPAQTAVRETSPKTSSAKVSADGDYAVQIAAVRNETESLKVWQRLVAKESDLFAGVEMDVQRADLGERGIFYRIRAAAFDGKPSAAKFCNDLKARSHDCLVVKR